MFDRRLALIISRRKAAALKKAAADPKFGPKDRAILKHASEKQAALTEYLAKLVAAGRAH